MNYSNLSPGAKFETLSSASPIEGEMFRENDSDMQEVNLIKAVYNVEIVKLEQANDIATAVTIFSLAGVFLSAFPTTKELLQAMELQPYFDVGAKSLLLFSLLLQMGISKTEDALASARDKSLRSIGIDKGVGQK